MTNRHVLTVVVCLSVALLVAHAGPPDLAPPPRSVPADPVRAALEAKGYVAAKLKEDGSLDCYVVECKCGPERESVEIAELMVRIYDWEPVSTLLERDPLG